MSIVIPRSTWKPRSANGCETIGTQEWVAAGQELWLHHSTTNPPGPDATLDEDCQHMRDFEAIGESRFGCGISYTWVVMPSGRVFQGHDVDRQGTHTYGRNNRARAICLAGDFEADELPRRMLNAVVKLLRELGLQLDGGHRDVFATACPGEHAYAKIPEMNRLAATNDALEEDDDVALNPDTDFPAFAAMMTRWYIYHSRPRGGRPTSDDGPTLPESLNVLLSRQVADVDEKALAAELSKLGVGGVSAAQVKQALTEVLSRTSLDVEPA